MDDATKVTGFVFLIIILLIGVIICVIGWSNKLFNTELCNLCGYNVATDSQILGPGVECDNKYIIKIYGFGTKINKWGDMVPDYDNKKIDCNVMG